MIYTCLGVLSGDLTQELRRELEAELRRLEAEVAERVEQEPWAVLGSLLRPLEKGQTRLGLFSKRGSNGPRYLGVVSFPSKEDKAELASSGLGQGTSPWYSHHT